MTHQPSIVIEAGIISRWLSIYPFGGPQASPARRLEAMTEIVKGESEYMDLGFGYSMQAILNRVFNIDVFRDQMIEYFLPESAAADGSSIDVFGWSHKSQREAWNRIPEGAIRIEGAWSTGSREIFDDRTSGVSWFRDVPEGAVRMGDSYSGNAGHRRREESLEERALRRRRREAVVVGRNGQPIQNEDIIQRDAVVLDEEGEEELERMEEEVADTEGTNERNLWAFLGRLRPDGLAPMS